MMRRRRWPEALWTQVLWAIAASCAWSVLVTERVLEIPESPLRAGLILISFVGVAVSAIWAARRLRCSRLRFLPLLLLAGVGAREGYRRALRAQYVASAPLTSVGLAESLWHPVTTTDIVLRYYTLASNRLAVQQLRVVLLADLHVTPLLPRAYYAHVRELVAAQHADLVLLAGDYVSKPENIELMTQLFTQPWSARWGVFAVLGNHDIWTGAAQIRELLTAAGVTLVTDRCEHLPKAIGRIAICGTEAPWGPELSFPLDRTELNLVLSHTPDNVFRLAEQGASVVFAGHTHGGQIRVPGFGSVVVPSRFGRLFDEGHFRVAQTDLFVTAGVGADMPPVRIYCPPEILVVDVTRQ